MQLITLILRIGFSGGKLASLYLRASVRIPGLLEVLVGCRNALRDLRRFR